MKLEIKHLAAHLCYGLKMIFESKSGRIITLTGITDQGKYGATIKCDQGAIWLEHCGFKPILLPLSDLTKEITHKGETFVPIERLNDIITLGDTEIRLLSELSWDWYFLPYWIVQKLHEWHFDTENLIGDNLAIDVTTLTENPYAK